MKKSLSLLALMISTALFADDDAQHMLVTGTRANTDWHENAAALAWLGQSSLDALKPPDMGTALNTMPGVFWVDLGNEQHAMSIRQPLSYSAVYLYMEDGIPIRPLGLFNHNALNEVNLFGTGQIEVLKGPASSLYGSNAVGGSVNFLTRKAEGNAGALSYRRDEQGYQRIDIRGSGIWQEGGIQLSHYSAQVRDGWQQHSDMDKNSTTLRIDQQLSDTTAFWFTATYSDLNTDMPGSLDQQDFDSDPSKSYNRFTYRSDRALRATAFLETAFTEQDTLRTALFYRENSLAQLPSYLIFNSFSNPTQASGRENDNQFESVGIDAFWRHEFRSAWFADLVTGVYIDQSPNDYDESNLSIVRDPATGVYQQYTATGVRRDYRTDIDNRAIYAQLRGAFAADWLWQLGARYDQIDYDFNNFLTPSNTTGPADESQSFSHLSPKLGLVHLLDSGHSLFFSYSQGFTPPEVSSLYGRLDVPNLQESVFDNIELGWRKQWQNARTDVTLYQLDGEDEIVSYSIAPGLSEPRNAGETRHRGIEFGLDWDFSKRWSFDVAMAWSTHEYLRYAVSGSIDYSGNNIKAAPEWLGQLALNYRPSDQWLLRAVAVHVEDYWMDDANTELYPGYQLLNLLVSWQLESVSLWFQGSNLSDEEYAQTASFSGSRYSYSPAAPRTLQFGISFNW